MSPKRQSPPESSPPALVVPRPRGCTNFKLRQLTRAVHTRYDAEIARAGLTAVQYSLLSHVLKLGPMRPVDLAAAMTLDASTLSRNLRPLLQAGWVQQVAGPDARSHRLQVTPEGAALRARAQAHWRAAQESLNAALGPEQVIALHALLDQALAALGEADALDPRAPVTGLASPV